MSPNKTLYIREEDQEAWERTDAAAHAAHQSLSQFLTGLIRRYLPEAPVADGDVEKITVKVGDGQRMWTEGFIGRWLARDESADYPKGVALTKRGQFAWHECVPGMNEGELIVYPSLDDLTAAVEAEHWPDAEQSASGESQLAGLPEFRALVAEAARSLGQEHVVWRDI